jgi:hypothetical protein
MHVVAALPERLHRRPMPNAEPLDRTWIRPTVLTVTVPLSDPSGLVVAKAFVVGAEEDAGTTDGAGSGAPSLARPTARSGAFARPWSRRAGIAILP